MFVQREVCCVCVCVWRGCFVCGGVESCVEDGFFCVWKGVCCVEGRGCVEECAICIKGCVMCMEEVSCVCRGRVCFMCMWRDGGCVFGGEGMCGREVMCGGRVPSVRRRKSFVWRVVCVKRGCLLNVYIHGGSVLSVQRGCLVCGRGCVMCVDGWGCVC